ncbi:MAG: hypothetical protein A2078_04260 [Nitrospirae bacterium GWC2_57_9]|nr:MAG: hypothetical protein A2078_04260 [Nitrospirae bacterium GWC2_57_9]
METGLTIIYHGAGGALMQTGKVQRPLTSPFHSYGEGIVTEPVGLVLHEEVVHFLDCQDILLYTWTS